MMRLKFEGRLVAFVQRAHVGPDPADAMFLEKPNEMRPMPAGMAEFDRETKIARQLRDEICARPISLPSACRKAGVE